MTEERLPDTGATSRHRGEVSCPRTQWPRQLAQGPELVTHQLRDTFLPPQPHSPQHQSIMIILRRGLWIMRGMQSILLLLFCCSLYDFSMHMYMWMKKSDIIHNPPNFSHSLLHCFLFPIVSVWLGKISNFSNLKCYFKSYLGICVILVFSSKCVWRRLPFKVDIGW